MIYWFLEAENSFAFLKGDLQLLLKVASLFIILYQSTAWFWSRYQTRRNFSFCSRLSRLTQIIRMYQQFSFNKKTRF